MRMTVCSVEHEGDPGRVAFVAAKRLGCAVVRNRSKRVLREAARACGLPRPGYELILFEMQAALRSLSARAGIDG